MDNRSPIYGLHRIAGIMLGAALALAITLLGLGLAERFGRVVPMSLFVFAVIAATAIGGFVAGLATLAVCLGLGLTVVMGPGGYTPVELLSAFTLTVESFAGAALIEALQRRTRRLENVSRELQHHRRHLERVALQDPLTGLGNRRAFERELKRALALAVREHLPFTLVMADVDGLKKTNDRSGHESGDLLLQAVADALVRSSREADSVYRVGGDEFVLLLPDTGRRDYEVVRTRVGEAFVRVTMRFDGAGLSMGAAHAPEDGMDSDSLLRKADRRMYESKVAKRRPAPAADTLESEHELVAI